jgi:DNA repair protein RecO (recombination protein O)
MPSRFRSQRTEAVVLRHQNWGEADRILTLYSQELGKVRALAKGVRKMRSRKAGHLEPFTRASLLLAQGRDLLLITQAEASDLYLPLREDLMRIGYAAYVVELLDRFTFEEGENPGLFRLLVNTLKRLSEEVNPAFCVRYYEVRLMDLVGFRPHLFHCARCGEEIQAQDQYFSAEQGGVLCPGCGQKTPGVRPISMLALRLLRHMQRSDYNTAHKLALPVDVDREVENIMQHYITYLLERNLNTPSFLRRVRAGS